MVGSAIAVILLHGALVGQALLPVLSFAKGEQARVPVLLSHLEVVVSLVLVEGVHVRRLFLDPVCGL
jgi:hypothetical protein